MNDPATLKGLTEAMLEAWNTQDVERVLACYTEDLVYRDPNTRGEVHGEEAMRRYLLKLLAGWHMRYVPREVHPIDGGEGVALLWRATFRKAGVEMEVVVDGMDLVQFRGQRVCRNEVYFDRAALAPLRG